MQGLQLRLRPAALRPSLHRANAAAEGETNNTSNRYKVKLLKPVGIVLEKAQGSNGIYVESVVADGAAGKLGLVEKGDQLISTSGVIYTGSMKYGNTDVKTGMEIVQLNVLNESFTAVMAAIRSHPGHVPVELEFERGTAEV